MKIDKGFSKGSGGLTAGDLTRMKGSFDTDNESVSYISFGVFNSTPSAEDEIIDAVVAEMAAKAEAELDAKKFAEGLEAALASEESLPGIANGIARALLARLDGEWKAVGEEMNRLHAQLLGENGLRTKLTRELAKPKGKQNSGMVRSLRSRVEKAEKTAELYCSAVFTAAGGPPPFMSKAQAKLMAAYGPMTVIERKLGQLTAKKARGVEGLEKEIRSLRIQETTLIAHVIQVRQGVPQFLEGTKAYANWCNSADRAEAKAGYEAAQSRKPKSRKPQPRTRARFSR